MNIAEAVLSLSALLIILGFGHAQETTIESTLATSPVSTTESTVATSSVSTIESTVASSSVYTTESTLATSSESTTEPALATSHVSTIESALVTPSLSTIESTLATPSLSTTESTLASSSVSTTEPALATSHVSTVESTVASSSVSTTESTLTTPSASATASMLATSAASTIESTLATSSVTTIGSTLTTPSVTTIRSTLATSSVSTSVPQNSFHRVLTDDVVGTRKLVVVGDIHGCYDEMIELFHSTGAMVNNTLSSGHLIILCGDFINRGPKSKMVLDFVKNNEIVTVRGNHEETIIEQYIRWKSTGKLKEKYQWVDQLKKKDLEFLQQLPYTVTIPSRSVIVVHAGLIPDVPLDLQDPIVMTTMRNLLVEGTNYTAFEDSKIGGVAWAKLWKGPEHVYFGHDAHRNLQDRSKSTGLDTGCVYGRNLTAGIVTHKGNKSIMSVAAHEAYVVDED